MPGIWDEYGKVVFLGRHVCFRTRLVFGPFLMKVYIPNRSLIGALYTLNSPPVVPLTVAFDLQSSSAPTGLHPSSKLRAGSARKVLSISPHAFATCRDGVPFAAQEPETSTSVTKCLDCRQRKALGALYFKLLVSPSTALLYSCKTARGPREPLQHAEKKHAQCGRSCI